MKLFRILWYEGIIIRTKIDRYLRRYKFWTRNASDEVTLSPTFYGYPNFFRPLLHLFVFWLVESSIICKSHRLNNRTVVVCYFIADEQHCATPSVSFDNDCSAGRLHRCAWRARSRRPHTHATCEQRVDAKASSDEAVVGVVDVEVDRCIDENSASNHG